MNFTCSKCGCSPNEIEHERINTDLATQALHAEPPVGWTCMECEPDLALVASGLQWGVVEVVGSSPEHQYEG